MALQILINIIIAILWMFLSESYTFAAFFSGYMIGILLLLLFERLVPDAFYLRRFWKIIKLAILFTRELILSNFQIIRYVYKPNLDLKPVLFTYNLNLRTNWEITLLANLISMTPGTLSVAISDDNSKLFIHAVDEEIVQDSIDTIENTFEKTIREVSR